MDDGNTSTTFAPGGHKAGQRARGVKRRIFGVVLVSLGALNLMLATKGGLGTGPFDYLLILSGVLFFLSGSLGGRIGA